MGVPRIKEIIHCTREPKNVTISIFLEPSTTFEQAWLHRGELVELTVGKALSEPPRILRDPLTDAMDDPLQELHFAVFETDVNMLSRHVLRLDFDQITLIQHGSLCVVV